MRTRLTRLELRIGQPTASTKMPRTFSRVSIANRHPRLRIDGRAVKRLIGLLDAHAAEVLRGGRGVPAGELSLVFLTDRALAALHATFLDDPTATDVITFEGNPAHGTAGEICVSADMAAVCARERQQPFADELTLYLVHGWLHLAGLDDRIPAKKRAMRRAEARAMRLLAAHQAIPRFSWRKAPR